MLLLEGKWEEILTVPVVSLGGGIQKAQKSSKINGSGLFIIRVLISNKYHTNCVDTLKYV